MRVLKLPALKDYSVCQEDAERAMTEVNGKTKFWFALSWKNLTQKVIRRCICVV